jgi:hypothetical protein
MVVSVSHSSVQVGIPIGDMVYEVMPTPSKELNTLSIKHVKTVPKPGTTEGACYLMRFNQTYLGGSVKPRLLEWADLSLQACGNRVQYRTVAPAGANHSSVQLLWFNEAGRGEMLGTGMDSNDGQTDLFYVCAFGAALRAWPGMRLADTGKIVLKSLPLKIDATQLIRSGNN